MKYPPYACQCCGIANSDMFYDWFVRTHNTEPNKEDWEAFRAYVRLHEEYKRQCAEGYKKISSELWVKRHKKCNKGGKQ